MARSEPSPQAPRVVRGVRKALASIAAALVGGSS